MGKSTLLRYLLNPDASNADLLAQTPSLRLAKEQIIRDDTNTKITIQAQLLDAPGHELQYAIDQLTQTTRDRIFKRKYIIIIVVAPTKGNNVRNEVDEDYIKQQLDSISIFWSALLKARKTVMPEAVVLFMNKLDLYDGSSQMSELFSSHINCLSRVCTECKIPFSSISGSVLDKSGMSELMHVIKRKGK